MNYENVAFVNLVIHMLFCVSRKMISYKNDKSVVNAIQQFHQNHSVNVGGLHFENIPPMLSMNELQPDFYQT